MEEIHKSLAETAAAHGAVSSTLNKGVSSHVLQPSVSLHTIRQLLKAVPNSKLSNVYLGALRETLVFSVNTHVSHSDGADKGTGAVSKNGKRKREVDPDEDRIQRAMQSIRTKAERKNQSISESQLEETGRAALALSKLQSLEKRRLLASYAIDWSGGPSETTPKFIVSARVAPGVAIPLGAFLSALGNCARDGMASTNNESTAAKKLPIAEHGAAAEGQGARSIYVYAAVAAPTLSKAPA